ncbi:tubulin-like doman-containing protein [Corynebacterium parakroppenstedtii]|uniref:tubulin-like doman-containing protein n=1 Tax=Corynebacterium parakroppenstedtii TaxID=2828363 RepID=UPI001C8DD25C|nr:tubulin-like doman-containing protein [Corynebacterium parakroppenstedtii]MBY0789270.1 hypothetical protein [Corynebacterium parakroppenstedtii]
MKKILVIGCGGSGAKTLAYMMDQLKTMLAEKMPEYYGSGKSWELPKAWQFVLIDSPSTPEKIAKLPNVEEAGGRYISCGSSNRYHTVDEAVSAKLARGKELGTISSWALREPNKVTTPISKGAGQYRAIGRMLTLSKLNEIQTQISKAWDTLNKAETIQELTWLTQMMSGSAQVQSSATKDTPLVFVVSSMAGGSGASMAIDVCRLLTGIRGFEVGSSSLFMVTPDAFGEISKDEISGANPNALAMFAELAAAQMGAATAPDSRIFKTLGVSASESTAIPVGRVFPVGARSGADGALLGDGSTATVYRALGRGLAALIMDDRALNDYVAYTLGNRGGLEPKKTLGYGWGADQNDIAWGSYGYAQLTMGRDRYGEYAAQRLARVAADKILHGHIDPSVDASSDVQLDEKLSNNWKNIRTKLDAFIPQPGIDPAKWIYSHFRQGIQLWVNRQVNELAAQIPVANNQRGAEWASSVEASLRNFDNIARKGDVRYSYDVIYRWADRHGIQEGIISVIAGEIAKYGVPYGFAVTEKIRHELENATLSNLGDCYLKLGSTRITLPPELQRSLYGQKGKISDTSAYVQTITSGVRSQIAMVVVGIFARGLADVLKDFAREFLSPLQEAMRRAQADLEEAWMLNRDPDLGVAQLKTDIPKLWPEESAIVPDRFDNAANEEFLTEVQSFPSQYEADVKNSIDSAIDSEHLDYESALRMAAQCVIKGEWEAKSSAAEPPRNLLVLDQVWVPESLTTNPTANSVRDVQKARFSVNIRPEEILSRSRQYIGRNGYSFQNFISTTIRDYILDPGISDRERNQRRTNFVAKFQSAMDHAKPLAQVNAELVEQLYGASVSYKFNFSAIPLDGDEVAKNLEQVVGGFPHFVPNDPQDPLGGKLTVEGEERAVDIFGSYNNYAPIVFDSLMGPIRRQWEESGREGAGFWRDRRTRPLPAALPMSDKERHALIAGWYIGWIIGSLEFPGTLDVEDDAPIAVWDESKWVALEQPLLTPPSRMRSKLDWLPSVLESVSLAWSVVGDEAGRDRIRFYQALRGIYDNSARPSTADRTSMGERHLNHWLFSGEAHNKRYQRKFGGPDATPEERRDKALEFVNAWANAAKQYVSSKQLKKGILADTSNRELADITSRQVASDLPVFADIAEDVMKVCQDIVKLINKTYNAGASAFESSFSQGLDVPTPTKAADSSMPGEDLF